MKNKVARIRPTRNVYHHSRRRLLLALGIAALSATAALAYSISVRNFRPRTMASAATPVWGPPQAPQQPPLAGPLGINRTLLDRHVLRALNGLGDRFESPGKERLTLVGTLTRFTGSAGASTAARIVTELPNKLRIEEQATPGLRVQGFDGKQPWALGGTPSDQDVRFILGMVRDTVEHFIAGQASGHATRVLGDRFRQDDGSAANYQGPFYDILKVIDTFTSSGQVDSRPTFFNLNSQTGLPERIVYEEQGGALRVSVDFGNWASVSGQTIPAHVIRKENGINVLELQVAQVSLTPAVADGIFDGGK